MKLISIIMPYYKKKAFVEEAINSVLRQSYKKFELILIYDDENLDDYKYISCLAKKDKRIKLFKNKKNLGSGLSRNLGIKHSKGFYLAFLDSDDVWFKDKLKVQLEYMEKNKLPISFTAYKIINEKGQVIGFRKANKIINFSHLINSCDLGLSTVVAKSSIIKKKFYFPNLKTKEDYVFWLKIAKKNIVFYGLSKNLSAWRRLSNSLSSNFFQKIFDGYLVYYKYMQYNFLRSTYCLIILSCYYLKKRFYEFIYS
jgi:teichuronic acid biosynthesis glycosyltransferase TuaG